MANKSGPMSDKPLRLVRNKELVPASFDDGYEADLHRMYQYYLNCGGSSSEVEWRGRFIAALEAQLAAMREYVAALYDGNNDLIDGAWDGLDDDTKKWLEKADDETRKKYRRKAAGG